MKNKTVAELRELAKKLGIAGYSKLRKEELLTAIAAARRPAAPKKPPGTTAPARKPATKTAAGAARPGAEKARPATVPAIPGVADEEQRIEGSKFAVAPLGEAAAARAYAEDVDENIEDLGTLAHAPRLSLLAQKPGVLYAYWRLPHGQFARQPGLRLRLGLVHDRAFHPQAEVALNGDQGGWYFHVNEDWHPEAVYLQLGYYDDSGAFIVAIDRGIVRLPRLFAASRYGVNWAVTSGEFSGIREDSGALGNQVPGGWPQGPSSYEHVSSHLMSSRGPRARDRN